MLASFSHAQHSAALNIVKALFIPFSVENTMNEKTYLEIVEASESREGFSRAFKRLEELSPAAQRCIRIFRKDYTRWERRSETMKLDLSPQDLTSVKKFFLDFPWWSREPHLLTPYTGGKRRVLTVEECEQIRKMIADLMKEKNTTTMAVEQAALRYLVTPRTIWKVWQNKYPPTGRSKPKSHKEEK